MYSYNSRTNHARRSDEFVEVDSSTAVAVQPLECTAELFPALLDSPRGDLGSDHRHCLLGCWWLAVRPEFGPAGHPFS
jgi:hypothetical protein